MNRRRLIKAAIGAALVPASVSAQDLSFSNSDAEQWDLAFRLRDLLNPHEPLDFGLVGFGLRSDHRHCSALLAAYREGLSVSEAYERVLAFRV